jgi:hypothetical protein
MKILIANDGPSAFYYIRMGYARAFSAAGHQVTFWDTHNTPVHDAFDECNPDIFMGQTYNCTRTVVEAIKERPHMKVIMKAGDWGPLADTIPTDDFGVLMASKIEQQTIKDLYAETGRPDYVSGTHGYWVDAGIPINHHMLAADVLAYTNGQKMPQFECDLAFVGGYWPYKAQNIDTYLLSLCNNFDYRIKIFGNAHWPVAQYCGFIPDELVRHALASATICPQLHEPHSTVYGFDMSERTFKLLANKCFVISDYVEGLNKLFGDDLVMAKSPEEFKKLVDHYLANPDERQGYIDRGYNKVMDEHTYFHRCRDVFQNLGFTQHANDLMEVYTQVRKNIDEEGNRIQSMG